MAPWHRSTLKVQVVSKEPKGRSGYNNYFLLFPLSEASYDFGQQLKSFIYKIPPADKYNIFQVGVS